MNIQQQLERITRLEAHFEAQVTVNADQVTVNAQVAALTAQVAAFTARLEEHIQEYEEKKRRMD